MKKVALVALLLACSGAGFHAPVAQAAPQTVAIKSAVMAHGYDGENAVGVTNTFKAAKMKVHCVVQLNRVATITAHATWYADLPGGKEITIADAPLARQLAEHVHFYLALKNVWPVGKYHVDVYINDKKMRSVPFSVVK